MQNLVLYTKLYVFSTALPVLWFWRLGICSNDSVRVRTEPPSTITCTHITGRKVSKGYPGSSIHRLASTHSDTTILIKVEVGKREIVMLGIPVRCCNQITLCIIKAWKVPLERKTKLQQPKRYSADRFLIKFNEMNSRI